MHMAALRLPDPGLGMPFWSLTWFGVTISAQPKVTFSFAISQQILKNIKLFTCDIAIYIVISHSKNHFHPFIPPCFDFSSYSHTVTRSLSRFHSPPPLPTYLQICKAPNIHSMSTNQHGLYCLHQRGIFGLHCFTIWAFLNLVLL